MLYRAFIGIAAVFAVCVSGCDLFSTRDAEPPVSGRNSWETPREPADVLTNMQAALFERDAVNYLRSFDEMAFHFEADPLALSHDPTLANWGYQAESQHISRLFSEGTLPSDSMLSLLFLAPEIVFLGDSAQIRSQYQLTAEVALTGVPSQLAGTADFIMRIGSEGYWQIQDWRDTRTEDAATWSDFKSLVR